MYFVYSHTCIPGLLLHTLTVASSLTWTWSLTRVRKLVFLNSNLILNKEVLINFVSDQPQDDGSSSSELSDPEGDIQELAKRARTQLAQVQGAQGEGPRAADQQNAGSSTGVTTRQQQRNSTGNEVQVVGGHPGKEQTPRKSRKKKKSSTRYNEI